MRATKAYIASLGTTGVLLGAAILLLAVVSAVVAFDRWPGAGVSPPAHTLVLAGRPAPIRVSTHATGLSVTRGATSGGRSGGALAGPRGAGGAGGVAGQRFSSGHSSAPTAPSALTPAVPGLPKAPGVPDPNTILDPISNPATTASQLADGAQSVTNAAGVTAGRISPDAGNAVSSTGDTAAGAVRQLPLPDHVVPGY